MMTPLWLNGTLMLARRILVDGEEYIQGCRLDWPAIRSRLLEEVQDLLPASDLEPVKDEASAVRGRKLASLPLILEPGELSAKLVPPGSSHTVPLVIAWVCFILAVLASATLLTAALSLSERRAAFVSAVTHELRTPLTTLRMYSEMLAEHMVPEEEKRIEYLNTLRGEADRLAHLVENVLAYARIERGAPAGRAEGLTLGELLDRVKPRLEQRAECAEMNLVFETESGDLEQPLRLDPGAVDQILFNLVDNACKYAAGAADRAIHLKADLGSGALVIRVRDHGPGIKKKDGKRLFRPFSKSARDAADSARGVGLGLALSRRLARMMGGDLSLDENVRDGACFVLSL
jgi:signal transduction histidine kinase